MFIFNELRKKKHKKLMMVPYILLYFSNGFLKNWSETRLFMSTIIFEMKKKTNQNVWTGETDGEML